MNSRLAKRPMPGSTCAALVVLTCSLSAAQQLPDAPAPASVPSAQYQPPKSPESSVPSSPASDRRVPQPANQSSSSSPASPSPVFWTNSDPNAHVTVLENTLFRVITQTPLHSGKTREGTPVSFMLSEDIVVNNVLIIPRGATLKGKVVQSRKAGALNGRGADLILQLLSLHLGGQIYPITSFQFRVQAASKTDPTEMIVGGAEVGALAGVVAGNSYGVTSATERLRDIGAGAAAGAAVGTVVSALTPGPYLKLPVESQMDFYLASPISVVPVTPDEAARLSQALPRKGPALFVEGDTP